MTKAQKEKIISLRKQKATYATISQEIGIPVNTIKSFCSRNGVSAEPQHPKNVCKHCGAVLAETSGTKPRLFCCDSCKQAWWNNHRKERVSKRMTTHTCPTCGRVFMDYVGANRKYCSQECYRERGVVDGQ